jgi:acetylornithine deacetylase/succinyl-diaminopimelate desuccinylase-like protein
MKAWQTYLAEHADDAVAEMIDFLRIPSISSLKEHLDDVQRAAQWTASRMRAAGIENVHVMPTDGHPVVYGDWLHAPAKPTALIYGHFDVQPADPLNLWTTPPFEPTIRDGRVYARGAGDDKGNMLIPILVAEAFLQAEGQLPINVKFIFEGQEELGSPQFVPFVAGHKDMLAADLVISADGVQESEDQPVLLVGLKGLVPLQIDVYGAKTDLHSGVYGGAIPNPIHALVRILDSLRLPDGKIAVPGFFDDVVDLTQEDREDMAAVPFDETKYFEDLGVSEGFGEPGYTPRERAWARPTLEINGIWGGFQGEGVKTVLPSEAHAKITCRLVANQEPDPVYRAIEAHVLRVAAEQTPGVRVQVSQLPGGGHPYLMPADHPANRLLGEVLTRLYGNPPYFVRMGGSVPVLVAFLRQLGVYTITLAFALEDERHHAPDEFFRLSSFEKGKQAFGEVWEKIGAEGLN